MKRIELLLKNTQFLKELNQIEKLEETRIYCRHDLSHLLDVARISWILVLEQNLSIEKSLVYAAALLHDIGRAMEYREGISHDEASVQLAKEILPKCGFVEDEIHIICEVILGHRHEKQNHSSLLLQQILREADWRSRVCFRCKAEKTCKWSQERKNKTILY